MVNERKNDTKIQKYVDTPKYATPITEKKQFMMSSGDSPTDWPKGSAWIAGDSILNGIN